MKIEVELVAKRCRGGARSRRSRCAERDELDLGAGQLAVGGDERQVVDAGGDDELARRSRPVPVSAS